MMIKLKASSCTGRTKSDYVGEYMIVFYDFIVSLYQFYYDFIVRLLCVYCQLVRFINKKNLIMKNPKSAQKCSN